MKRKLFIMACIVSLFAFTNNVSAEEVEVYYVNNNGVSFTEEEYDFITNMYWDGYQEYITQEELDEMIETDVIHGEFASNEYEEIPMYLPKATVITTAAKTLKINRSCSNICLVSTLLIWNQVPGVRSNDMMGAYLDGVTRETLPTTTIIASGGTTTSTNRVLYSNGFGVVVPLPSSFTSCKINQTFYTTTGGTIYASYQHAMTSISATNAKNFTMSRTGFGGVFSFSGVAYNTYDRMNGVYVTV